MRCLSATIGPVIALALVAGTLSAGAQQSGPIRLAPLPPPVGANNAPEARPAPDATDAVTSPGTGDVVIRGLDAVAEDAVGVLGPDDGGLGNDMWAGTDRTTALRLLAALPAAYPNPEIRDLARRLLLSIAVAPANDGPARDDEASLLAARVAGLVAIGAPDDAIALARAANSRQVPDHLARPLVAAHFLRGDTPAACGVLNGYAGGYAAPFWQRALIVCQIADGKGAEASLGLDLLREERGEADPVFQDIAYAVAVGAPVAPEQLEAPGRANILTLALLNQAEAALPDWFLDTDDPALVRAILAAAGTDPLRRLRLAHRALRRGIVDPAEVVSVYDGLEVADETIAEALADPDSVDRDRWLAYLYLAARNQSVAVARSEALWEAWTLARAAEADDIVMATTAALLEDVPATNDFGWLAADATRAALLAGADELAIEWYLLVVRQARTVADMARATTILWPEMRIIGRNPPDAPAEPGKEVADAPVASTAETIAAIAAARTQTPVAPPPRAPVPWSPSRLSRWIELAANNPGTADIGTVLYLLQIFGDPVSEENWHRASLAPRGEAAEVMPGVAALAGLARASVAGRRAETALYALIVLGQAGEVPHAGLTGTAVRGLLRVGLAEDALAIARAALVAQTR